MSYQILKITPNSLEVVYNGKLYKIDKFTTNFVLIKKDIEKLLNGGANEELIRHIVETTDKKALYKAIITTNTNGRIIDVKIEDLLSTTNESKSKGKQNIVDTYVFSDKQLIIDIYAEYIL